MKRKQMKLKTTLNTLEVSDGSIVKPSFVHKRDIKFFSMIGTDLDKIKAFKGKLYSKAHKTYKHYVLYEYNYQHVTLIIRLPNMIYRPKVFGNDKNEFYMRE